jgi:hypothetical protein
MSCLSFPAFLGFSLTSPAHGPSFRTRHWAFSRCKSSTLFNYCASYTLLDVSTLRAALCSQRRRLRAIPPTLKTVTSS